MSFLVRANNRRQRNKESWGGATIAVTAAVPELCRALELGSLRHRWKWCGGAQLDSWSRWWVAERSALFLRSVAVRVVDPFGAFAPIPSDRSSENHPRATRLRSIVPQRRIVPKRMQCYGRGEGALVIGRHERVDTRGEILVPWRTAERVQGSEWWSVWSFRTLPQPAQENEMLERSKMRSVVAVVWIRTLQW